MPSLGHETHRAPPAGEVITSLRDDAALTDGFDLIVLFGSIARDEAHVESDVDLIVDGPAVTSVERLAQLRGALIERLGCSVELLALRDALDSPEVLVGALRDGLVVIDSQRQWPGLLADRERFEAEAHAVYDSYPARRAAALARLSAAAPSR